MDTKEKIKNWIKEQRLSIRREQYRDHQVVYGGGLDEQFNCFYKGQKQILSSLEKLINK
jgi:hypothetical protein